MNIEIVEHKHPKLKIPECVCDKELHAILNNYELLKIAFNKLSSATLIIGKPGQGKTTSRRLRVRGLVAGAAE